MAVLVDMTDEFDEHRFRALLDLAGPATARELATRLDEDLTAVADAMSAAGVSADRQVLRAQSHVLLAIAGTVGANRLYRLSVQLNGLARASEGGPFGELLTEIRALLDHLIARIRSARVQLAAEG